MVNIGTCLHWIVAIPAPIFSRYVCNRQFRSSISCVARASHQAAPRLPALTLASVALAQYSMPVLYASSPVFSTTLYCIALYGIICRGLRAGISAAAVSATPLRPPAAVSAAEAV